MAQFSLFTIGLIGMFFFILCSNVLNYVAIATTQWLEDEGPISLWRSCYFPGNVDQNDKQPAFRAKCFLDNPPALIATGTALNCLSFLLIIVSLLSLINSKFKNSFALYFVIGAEITTLLALLFNSTGWYFIFNAQYQNTFKQLANNGNPKTLTPGYRLGWSFWLMAGSFAASVLAAVLGSSLLGCTCITNKYESQRFKERKYQTSVPKYEPSPIIPVKQPPPPQQEIKPVYIPDNRSTYVETPLPIRQDDSRVNYARYIVDNNNLDNQRIIYYPNDSNDPQVLRL